MDNNQNLSNNTTSQNKNQYNNHNQNNSNADHQNQSTNYSNPYQTNNQFNGNYNQNYHQGYNQNNNPYYNNQRMNRPYDPNSEPMTLKDWIITYLLLMIPIANIVFIFMWAFGSNVNKSKKTFFQAYLIIVLAGIVLSVFIGILLSTLFASILFNAPTYLY